ncbi:MAG: hypothetical protein AB1405_16025 [Bdellovibrionota bacterium]
MRHPLFLFTCLLEAALFSYLLSEPLFWAFHFEYALAANLFIIFAGSIWTILSLWPTAGIFDRSGAKTSLIRILLLAAIPFALALGAQVLVGTCDWIEGMAWYGILPGVGAIITWGTALLCSLAATRRRAAYWIFGFVFLGAAAVIGARLYFGVPFKIHNLLLGFWPGVLYDEFVPIEPGVLFARFQALLLGGWLSLTALSILKGKRNQWVLPDLLLIAFVISPAWERDFFVNLSRNEVEEELSLHFEGEHARWFATDATVTRTQLPLLAARLDYQVKHVAEDLGIAQIPPIRVYLFESPEQKRKIFGAEHTVVTRPWLGDLYLHAGPKAQAVLRHEIVHLVSAAWAYKPVGISPNIALLEGLAVSFQGGFESFVDPADLVRAVLEEKPDFPLENFLAGASFWKFAHQLAYPMAGAFVDFLRKNAVPDEPLSILYRRGRTKSKETWRELVSRWRGEIEKRPAPPPAAAALAKKLLAARPLHEKRCAHEVAECLHGGNGGKTIWAGTPESLALIQRARTLDPGREDLKEIEGILSDPQAAVERPREPYETIEPEEIPDALAAYEEALLVQDFGEAASHAAHVAAFEGAPEFLKEEAAGAAQEAEWLEKNFEKYRLKTEKRE